MRALGGGGTFARLGAASPSAASAVAQSRDLAPNKAFITVHPCKGVKPDAARKRMETTAR
jgi:hypothetical protein